MVLLLEFYELHRYIIAWYFKYTDTNIIHDTIYNISLA